MDCGSIRGNIRLSGIQSAVIQLTRRNGRGWIQDTSSSHRSRRALPKRDEQGGGEKMRQMRETGIPSKRVGTVEDMAAAAIYLAAERAIMVGET
jgi:NAD(P)-dependent dehydrogenase (short-subunit alcohol dehydrogenase family)